MADANVLYGYLKNDLSTTFIIGEPKFPCNMLDNANEMKSSFKAIVMNSRESAYEVNTIVRHDDSNTFWVIKSDTSTFIGEDSDGTTKLYTHTIDMENAFEYLSYKYLPPCVFPKDKYTLTQFIYRLQIIAKLNDFNAGFASFLSSDYKMKYFSFKNYTVASAIKEVSKTINAIPKLTVNSGILNLSWISRNGDGSLPLGDIDTIFPSRFRKSNSSSAQYTTRVYSELENAKDTNVAIFPNGFGTKAFTPNSLSFNGDNSVIELPNNIDSIERIEVKMGYQLIYSLTGDVIDGGKYAPTYDTIRTLMYNYNESLGTKIINSADILATNFNTLDLQSITEKFGAVSPAENSAFERYAVKSKKFYDELEATGAGSKQYCFYYEEKSNQIIIPTKFDFGGESLMPFSIILIGDVGTAYYALKFGYVIGDPYEITDNRNIYFKVHYKPIVNLTLSYDNDSEAQDERPYNQTGKLIDGYTASKLVSVYVDESAGETLVRSGEYYSFDSIPTCGQKVLKNNIAYVINQRSIDFVSNDLYQVEFNLSIARTARDENISADDSIEKGAIPNDNLLRRVQIYKDYIEVSVDSTSEHTETPYLVSTTLFDFDDETGIGFDINMDGIVETKTDNGEVIDYLYIPSTKHNLVREMVYKLDFNDNFILGIQQLSTAVQKPIRYADEKGDVGWIYVDFINENDILETLAEDDLNNLPVLTESIYNSLTSLSLVSINDNPYSKSSYEIPVFEYIYEIKGNINRYAQIILADNILERFNIRYSSDHYLFEKTHYYFVISSLPITQENALERWETLYIDESKDIDTDNIVLYQSGGFYLFSQYADGVNIFNSTAIQDKHIGIFAVSNELSETTPKFIMAINYYKYVNSALSTKDYYIPIFINNWKI